MKKSREELENVFHIVVKENRSDERKLKENMKQSLSKHNIPIMEIMMILNENEMIPIQSLSNAELFLFTKALFDITLNNKVNPEIWFNEDETKSYSEYIVEESSKSDFVVFENVDQVSEEQFICTSASYKNLANIWANGKITYNIRTQRETKIIKFNDIAAVIPTINSDAVINMTNLMVNNKFTPNMISLNIRKTGTERFGYNVQKRTLTIFVDNENTFLDIIDGMHRTLAFIRSIEENPNMGGFTSINILHYTEERAQQFIEQEDNRTPIDKTKVASFKNDDNGVNMAKEIAKQGNESNNELFNKIAVDYNELQIPFNKYTTVALFAQAFNYNFKIEQPRDFTKIKGFLVEYFNELIGCLRDNNKTEYITNNYFIGYVAIASKLYNVDNWINYVNKIVCDIDFEDKDLINAGIKNKTIKPSHIRKISEYFKSLVVKENV